MQKQPKRRLPLIDMDELATQPMSFASEFSYTDVSATEADQANVVGEGTLNRCVITKTRLDNAKLRNLSLLDVQFIDTELSNTQIQLDSATRTEFTRCRGVGLRIGITHARDVYFGECKLDYSTIDIQRAKGPLIFENCSIREAIFTGDLSQVRLLNCDLTKTEFLASTAKNCDLRGSKLDEAKGLITLSGAIISPDQAIAIAYQLATEAGFMVDR